jgi:hypothetical protein
MPCAIDFAEYIWAVSASEIKESIDQMTEEERCFAAAYLQHLAQEHDPAYKTMIAERMAKMDAGRKITLEQAKSFHETLEASARF